MPQRVLSKRTSASSINTGTRGVSHQPSHTHQNYHSNGQVGLACLGKKQNEKELKLTLLIMEKSAHDLQQF